MLRALESTVFDTNFASPAFFLVTCAWYSFVTVNCQPGPPALFSMLLERSYSSALASDFAKTGHLTRLYLILCE